MGTKQLHLFVTWIPSMNGHLKYGGTSMLYCRPSNRSHNAVNWHMVCRNPTGLRISTGESKRTSPWLRTPRRFSYGINRYLPTYNTQGVWLTAFIESACMYGWVGGRGAIQWIGTTMPHPQCHNYDCIKLRLYIYVYIPAAILGSGTRARAHIFRNHFEK